MIDFLVSKGMNPKTTTLIGHSLGAHVMGISGYNTAKKVKFIYGKFSFRTLGNLIIII